MALYCGEITNEISIHAPREGGDSDNISADASLYISIHAPREGGDRTGRLHEYLDAHFNPRPPRGGRLMFI